MCARIFSFAVFFLFFFLFNCLPYFVKKMNIYFVTSLLLFNSVQIYFILHALILVDRWTRKASVIRMNERNWMNFLQKVSKRKLAQRRSKILACWQAADVDAVGNGSRVFYSVCESY